MDDSENQYYANALAVISNTRLFFNTNTELENYFAIGSIGNNSINRFFSNNEKRRAAYRDLQVELYKSTGLQLDEVIKTYEESWDYYKKNLSRKKAPEALAVELLSYYLLPNYDRAQCKHAKYFAGANKSELSLPFLFLFLLKALPGYSSTSGDVNDLDEIYDEVFDQMLTFTQGSMFDILPPILRAKEDKRKSRIRLLYHVYNTLSEFYYWYQGKAVYNLAQDGKAMGLQLDIEGMWSSGSTSGPSTEFWQIVCNDNYGGYFVTHYAKKDNTLQSVRYTMVLNKYTDEFFRAYILHPQAVQQRIDGNPYGDADNVWYQGKMPGDKTIIDRLDFSRLLNSSHWPSHLLLNRVQDPKLRWTYEEWLEKLPKDDLFAQFYYTFHARLYAITLTHLYIRTDTPNTYYKVPRHPTEGIIPIEGVERIKLGDNVGIMHMNRKEYIVFDELMVYLPVNMDTLQKYGIEKVEHII